MKTYLYRLYPSRSQKKRLDSVLETCRRVYNDCLAERKEAWESEQRSVSKVEQLRHVKTVKTENPYAKDVHSHILQVAVTDLDKAFQAFFRRVKAGEAPGYPRFKGRGRFSSFGLKEYGNGFKIDGRRLKLTGIGRVPVRWHRPIEGQVKTVRIIRKPDGWYAAFSCETTSIQLPSTGRAIGVDVGLRWLFAFSDGATVENPRWYRESQAKRRILQRRVSRRRKGGTRRRKAVQRLARHHQHVANQRRDFLNKIVARLIADHDLVAIEDLRILNMVRNRHLSQSILDAAWGFFQERLIAKAAEAGRSVVEVDPAYTSQTCSGCGQRFPEHLSLAVRWVSCECGLFLDRDTNAAINVLTRAGHARQASTLPVGVCVA